MSKTDDMRALREARHDAARARATPPTATPPTAKSEPKAKKITPREAKDEGIVEPAPDGLCGHRAISGRTCTREQAHAAKSHRYS